MHTRILHSTAILLSSLLTLSACGETRVTPDENTPQPHRHFADALDRQFAERQFAVYDPAQPVNKQVYKFNAELDKYFFIPVVDAYKYVTPEPVRHSVANFFMNVGEVTNFMNALFQMKPYQATKTLGRFAVNTTVGLLGTFDVATDWGLPRQPEDFGETLGYWGVAPGAYVVLPVLGPSNVRDTFGKVADYATLYFVIPSSVRDSTAYDVVAYGVEPINARYVNDFRYYSTGSPFDYELVRYIATRARAQDIANQRK